MANVKIKSKLTNESESKQTVPVKIFKITDIPDVMEKKVGQCQHVSCENGSMIHITKCHVKRS